MCKIMRAHNRIIPPSLDKSDVLSWVTNGLLLFCLLAELVYHGNWWWHFLSGQFRSCYTNT